MAPKTLISKNGYGIYLDSITPEEVEKIKRGLTVKPIVVSDYDFGSDKSFPVYKLSDTRIYLPKWYGIKNYGSTKSIVKDGVDANLMFNGELKDHQIDFCDKVLEELNTKNSCIACSTTGSGKTTISLWLASKIKKRTLIIVHKEFLMNQWIERIKQFIPSASIGIIRQDKCEIDNDIIIGMIQTIVKREYPPKTFDSVHFIIYDEIHHCGAQGFSQVFSKIGSKTALGLSATPERSDGLTKVIEWFLGSIIKNEIVSEIEKPVIKFVVAEYGSKIVPKFNFKGTLNAPNLINQLVIDPIRNKQIVNEIINLNKEGRKILVLSGRREHCEFLSNEVGKINDKIVTGLYLGSMKKEHLDTSNKAEVIFATYDMASEAYDNPDLDTLIMATGRTKIEQSVGRILRKKNKLHPLVVDFTDIEFFGYQAKSRKQYYKKKGYVYGSVMHMRMSSTCEGIHEEDESDSDTDDEECLFD